jgi:hypothetical protein
MAALPRPNPLDSGLLPRGMPIDYIRTSKEYCFLCDTHTDQHLFKLVMANHIGFGTPWFVKPFLKRSSTRGKTGKRQHYSMCMVCETAWAADESTRSLLLEDGLGVGTNHASVGALGIPTEANYDRFSERTDEELKRQFPDTWLAQQEDFHTEAATSIPQMDPQTESTLSAPTALPSTPSTPSTPNTPPALHTAFTKQPTRSTRPATQISRLPPPPKQRDLPIDDWIAELKQLGGLRDEGLLTEEEFVVQKRRILPDSGGS